MWGAVFLGPPQRLYSDAREEKVVMVKFAAESFHTRGGGGQKSNTSSKLVKLEKNISKYSPKHLEKYPLQVGK